MVCTVCCSCDGSAVAGELVPGLAVALVLTRYSARRVRSTVQSRRTRSNESADSAVAVASRILVLPRLALPGLGCPACGCTHSLGLDRIPSQRSMPSVQRRCDPAQQWLAGGTTPGRPRLLPSRSHPEQSRSAGRCSSTSRISRPDCPDADVRVAGWESREAWAGGTSVLFAVTAVESCFLSARIACAAGLLIVKDSVHSLERCRGLIVAGKGSPLGGRAKLFRAGQKSAAFTTLNTSTAATQRHTLPGVDTVRGTRAARSASTTVKAGPSDPRTPLRTAARPHLARSPTWPRSRTKLASRSCASASSRYEWILTDPYDLARRPGSRSSSRPTRTLARSPRARPLLFVRLSHCFERAFVENGDDGGWEMRSERER